MRGFLSSEFAFGSFRDEWIIIRGGGDFGQKYFFANLTDSGNSKTFLFFMSDDLTGDATSDFLGDINNSQCPLKRRPSCRPPIFFIWNLAISEHSKTLFFFLCRYFFLGGGITHSNYTHRHQFSLVCILMLLLRGAKRPNKAWWRYIYSKHWPRPEGPWSMV